MRAEHEAKRLEVERQVKEFLEKGGIIKMLPGFVSSASKPVKTWERLNF